MKSTGLELQLFTHSTTLTELTDPRYFGAVLAALGARLRRLRRMPEGAKLAGGKR